jgi:hypothetical protein
VKGNKKRKGAAGCAILQEEEWRVEHLWIKMRRGGGAVGLLWGAKVQGPLYWCMLHEWGTCTWRWRPLSHTVMILYSVYWHDMLYKEWLLTFDHCVCKGPGSLAWYKVLLQHLPSSFEEISTVSDWNQNTQGQGLYISSLRSSCITQCKQSVQTMPLVITLYYSDQAVYWLLGSRTNTPRITHHEWYQRHGFYYSLTDSWQLSLHVTEMIWDWCVDSYRCGTMSCTDLNLQMISPLWSSRF